MAFSKSTEYKILNILGYTALSMKALRVLDFTSAFNVFLFIIVALVFVGFVIRTYLAFDELFGYWKNPHVKVPVETEIGIDEFEDYKPALKNRYADLKRQLYNCAALMHEEGFTKEDWNEAREMAKAARRGELP
jgi:hypothetical protein